MPQRYSCRQKRVNADPFLAEWLAFGAMFELRNMHLMNQPRLALFALLPLVAGIHSFGQGSPMFRGDPVHSGIYAGAGAPKFHVVRWSFHTNGEVVSSPAIVGGVVYIGSNDGNLYAIDEPSGKLHWKFETGSAIPSSPAVAAGIIYFASYDGNFYAVDAVTGKLRWKFAISGERRYAGTHLHGMLPAGEAMPDPYDVYLSSPVVWNGMVYFGSGDGNVYALNATSGAIQWKFHTGDVVHASPAIAQGKLYVGSWDSYFYALDAATGKQLWRFKTGEDPKIHNQVGIQSSATIADGVVYFGCRDSKVYALDAATGRQRWFFSNHGSWVITSPVVKDGKLYFATSDTALFHALDGKTGTPLYSVKFHWPIFGSPAIAGNTLYLPEQNGKLTAIDLLTQKPAWVFQTAASRQNLPKLSKPDGSPDYESVFTSIFYDDTIVGIKKLRSVGSILSSPVVSGRTVYLGTSDGNLYSLQ
jgi:eukaryotic-like serine/threonine-protein kinase